jgi:flagellar motor protein MotB
MVSKSNHLQSFRASTVLIFFIALFLSWSAYSLTPEIYGGKFSLTFLKQTTMLTEASRALLARHLQKIAAIQVPRIEIVAYREHDLLESNGGETKISLAESRANEMRRLLIEAGVAASQIQVDIFEFSSSEQDPTGGQSGFVIIHYDGFRKPNSFDISKQ